MNPFSRFLSQWLSKPDLLAFVELWDVLEALVVTIYKSSQVTSVQDEQFRAIQPQLRKQHDFWAGDMEPLWQATLVGGKPAQSSPFLRLIEVEAAVAFVDDWEAMQHLPAAREALNQLILAQSK